MKTQITALNDFYIRLAKGSRFDSMKSGVCIFRVTPDDVYIFPELSCTKMVHVTLGRVPSVEFVSLEVV